MSAADRLRELIAMPRAEVVARKNAWEDVQRTAALVLAEAASAAAHRESSPELASLAGELMNMDMAKFEANYEEQPEELLKAIRSLAASVLSQAEPDAALSPDDPDKRAARALQDAQLTGQSHPIVETVVIDPPESESEIKDGDETQSG